MSCYRFASFSNYSLVTRQTQSANCYGMVAEIDSRAADILRISIDARSVNGEAGNTCARRDSFLIPLEYRALSVHGLQRP